MFQGRHKRNATFPGGQSTTILQGPTATIRSGTPNPIRPRYNSCHTESSTTPGPNCGNNNSNGTTNWNNNPNNTTNQQDTIPTRDSDSQNLSSQPPTKDVLTSSPTLIETRTGKYFDISNFFYRLINYNLIVNTSIQT